MSDGSWTAVGFWAFAALAVIPGILILFSKNIVRAAFWLLGALLGFAGLYMTIGADFLAFTQVLVYIGGILVLILFGVMLTHKDPLSIQTMKQTGRWVPGAIAGVLLLAGTLYMALATRWEIVANSSSESQVPTTARIGDLFMTKFILPFEIVSVLLLACLVGAVYIARGREAAE